MPTPQEQIEEIRRNRDRPSGPPNRAEGTGRTKGGKKDKKGKKNYRERLRSPGQRATIPDEVLRRLDPGLYQRRMENKRLATPFVEGSPLTNRDIARERSAEETLRYGPQEADLARQEREAQSYGSQRMVNIGNWFDQYKADLDKAKSAQAQQYADAIGQVQGTIGASQAAADTSRQQITDQMTASAAARGQTYTGQGATEAAAGQGSRRNLQDSLVGLLTAQQGAQTNYVSARQGVGGAAQLTERLRESERQKGEREEFGKAKTEISREKGAFRTEYTSRRRDEERRNVLENKAFGLDVAKAEQEAAADVQASKDKAADRRARQRTESNKVNQWGYTNKEWRAMSPDKRLQIQAKIKRAGRQGVDLDKINSYGYTERQWRGMSTDRRRRIIDDSKSGGSTADKDKHKEKVRAKTGDVVNRIGSARSDYDRYARTPYEDKDGKKRKPTRDEIRAQLRKEGYEPWEIDIAERRRRGLPLTPGQMEALRRAGARTPSRWRPGSRGPRPESSNPGAGQ